MLANRLKWNLTITAEFGMPRLTTDRGDYGAREVLEYDRATGVCTWKISTGKRARIGAAAGSLSKQHGYIEIRIDGESHLLHRVIYLMETGNWPEHEIDHRN